MSGLFGSPILEVVIGLSFIYFLLSMICSHINEIIVGLFKWRARDLELGIQNLLCDPNTALAVLNHPLIKAMGNTGAETLTVRLATWLWGSPKRAGKPSYLSADTFTMALLDYLAPAANGPTSVERIRGRALELASVNLDDLKSSLQTLATSLAKPTPTDKEQLDALTKAVESNQTLDEIRATAHTLPRTEARRRFLSLIEAIDGQRSIGKALLSLIDQSQNIQNRLITVTHVTNLIANLEDPKKQIQDAIAKAETLDEIRAIVRSLPESNARVAMLDFIGKGETNVEAFRNLIEHLPASQDVELLKAAVHPQMKLDQARDAVQVLPESHMRTVVLDFIEKGQASLEDIRKSVENWYDNAMDRVSDVYKRRIQYWLLVIAACITLVIGADTLRIANTLSTNSALRSLLTAEAAKATNISGSQVPAIAVPGATTTMTPTITTAISETGVLVNELGKFTQVLGYDDIKGTWSSDWWSNSDFWRQALWKCLGLLITIFAVSLGAPFWFDLLNKFVNLRASGPPPRKANVDAKDKATS
jgi:hypothetical protein